MLILHTCRAMTWEAWYSLSHDLSAVTIERSFACDDAIVRPRCSLKLVMGSACDISASFLKYLQTIFTPPTKFGHQREAARDW